MCISLDIPIHTDSFSLSLYSRDNSHGITVFTQNEMYR